MITNIEPGASIGYIVEPTPYTAPLVNPFRYEIKWWQGEDSDLPKYVIFTENDEISSKCKLILKSRYEEIKRFEKIPKILLNFRYNKLPARWNYPSPFIYIYKKLKEGKRG